ncbi:MAG TPA: glutathione S-transferase N-terminal domain-containing protein [Alphaproteobacteria bacterium]|nr:glutathione S-transferase N-terminal domain-containing protein [Alphaproteobacteria bacterium]
MKLRYSSASPYVRKVLAVAYETGLESRIERVPTAVWTPDTDIGKENPLGKVPSLTTDEGDVLYDSPVICEYLDSLHNGAKLFPPAGPERWKSLKLQSLADGILDAAILRRLEGTQRPVEQQSKKWMDRQAQAVERGMDSLERLVAGWGEALTIGQIAAACACGYLDFRFGHEDWRSDRAKLAAWYERFSKRPSIQATVPRD